MLTAGSSTSSVCFPPPEKIISKKSKEKKSKSKKQHKHKKEKVKTVCQRFFCLVLPCLVDTVIDFTEEEREEAPTQRKGAEEEEQERGVQQQWGG